MRVLHFDPTAEHPTVEHPTVEHPTAEHPTAEHPTVELKPLARQANPSAHRTMIYR